MMQPASNASLQAASLLPLGSGSDRFQSIRYPVHLRAAGRPGQGFGKHYRDPAEALDALGAQGDVENGGVERVTVIAREHEVAQAVRDQRVVAETVALEDVRPVADDEGCSGPRGGGGP